MISNKNPLLARYRASLLLSALLIIASALLRIVLWFDFGRDENVTISDLFSALGVGLLNDSVVVVYFLGVVTFFNLIIPNKIFQSKSFSITAQVLTFGLIFGILYLEPTEFFFFEEFDARFNLVAVDYLIYPHEVLINLWDSYPVVWFMIGGLSLTSIIYFKYFKDSKKVTTFPGLAFSKRLTLALIHFSLIGALAGFTSTDSINVSENRVTNEIAHNGISSFFKALRTSEVDYDVYYKTIDKDRAYTILRNDLTHDGSSFVDPTLDNINRFHPAKEGGFGKMNVVILSEESLGGQFIGALGNKNGLSPNIDRLANESLFFNHAYATGTRTVRGLEAISSSFPPIPSESILKRPGQEHMFSLGQVMQEHGYKSIFFYGGFSYFDNMQSFYSSKGFEIQDRFNIKDPEFANIWGVSDVDLFNHAINYMDKVASENKPFFSLVMTTSNHKPFTFPEGIPNIPAKGGGRDAGVRYADYAIGKFFEVAKQKSWYNNTLFVVIADHDSRVYGKAQIPMEHYEIPMMIIAPNKITPRRVNTLTTQLDLAPTILGLLGLPYTAPFYGQDVLALDENSIRSIPINHNHNVSLYRDNKVVVLGLNKAVNTFKYDRNAASFEEIAEDKDLTELAVSYYQTGFDQFKRQKYHLNVPGK